MNIEERLEKLKNNEEHLKKFENDLIELEELKLKACKGDPEAQFKMYGLTLAQKDAVGSYHWIKAAYDQGYDIKKEMIYYPYVIMKSDSKEEFDEYYKSQTNEYIRSKVDAERERMKKEREVLLKEEIEKIARKEYEEYKKNKKAEMFNGKEVEILEELFSEADLQFLLGLMYYMGKAVPQDYKEAFRWLKVAADQGHANAQYALGNMHSYGFGMPVDNEEAIKWYNLAAEQGHNSAKSELEKLAGETSC